MSDELDFNLSFDEPAAEEVETSTHTEPPQEIKTPEETINESVAECTSEVDDLTILFKELTEEAVEKTEKEEVRPTSPENNLINKVAEASAEESPSASNNDDEIDFSKVFDKNSTPLAIMEKAPIRRAFSEKITENGKKNDNSKILSLISIVGVILILSALSFTFFTPRNETSVQLSKAEIKKLLAAQPKPKKKTQQTAEPAKPTLHWNYKLNNAELEINFRATKRNDKFEEIFIDINSNSKPQITNEDIISRKSKPWFYRLEAQDFVQVATDSTTSATLLTNARAFVLNNENRERIIIPLKITLTQQENSELKVNWLIDSKSHNLQSEGLFIDTSDNNNMLLSGGGEFFAPSAVLAEQAHRDVTKFMKPTEGDAEKTKGKKKDKKKDKKKKKVEE